jgi:hypothetical protein
MQQVKRRNAMLRKIMFQVACFSILFVASAYAVPDSTIVEGDLHITGTPLVNGLVFPDNSVQSSATVQGPQGIQGPKGDQGIQGPPGTNPGQVLITPNKNLKILDTHQLVATSFDSSNNQFPTHSYTWTSANPGIATVSSTGLVSAISAGTAIISVLETTNNISGLIPIRVLSLTGDWISSIVNTTSTCLGVTLCSLHFIETPNGSGTVTTNSCTDSCNNVYALNETFQRTGSSISLSGTLIYTPSGGKASSMGVSCLTGWDGINVLSSYCTMGSGLLINTYVRN